MFVTFITIVVMVAQLWALSRYSCVYLGSLYPRNFGTFSRLHKKGWCHSPVTYSGSNINMPLKNPIFENQAFFKRNFGLQKLVKIVTLVHQNYKMGKIATFVSPFLNWAKWDRQLLVSLKWAKLLNSLHFKWGKIKIEIWKFLFSQKWTRLKNSLFQMEQNCKIQTFLISQKYI